MNISFVPSSKVSARPLSDAVFRSLTEGKEGGQLAWPAGSFLLTNASQQPITAVVVEWQSVDELGLKEDTQLNLDGYLVASDPQIVAAHGATVVTPKGSVRTEHVARLAHGDGFVGLVPTLSPEEMRDQGAHPNKVITVLIDAVIFADGEIVGPDTTRYENVIQDRYQAARFLLSGIASARAKGIDDAAYLNQTIADTKIHDTLTSWQVRFAKRLLGSPNLQGTLDDMKMMTIPKQFFKDAQTNGDMK
jgi:hypothetical protein